MSIAAEPCLLLLNRAYCYLRFSGLDAAAACQQLQTLTDQLAGFDPQGGRDEASRERLWQQVVERAALAGAARTEVAAAPALLRGHVRYADRGR